MDVHQQQALRLADIPDKTHIWKCVYFSGLQLYAVLDLYFNQETFKRNAFVR